MLVKCLQICAHVFINRPQDQILVVHACPILFRLRSKLCPNFGCSRARLCPISFAPCPFPNLAGTLKRDGLHTSTMRNERAKGRGQRDFYVTTGQSSMMIRNNNSTRRSQFVILLEKDHTIQSHCLAKPQVDNTANSLLICS